MFGKLQIVKALGSGVFGTSYLVKHKTTKKKYVLKVQKVLPADRPRRAGRAGKSGRASNGHGALKRELDAYDAVELMPRNVRIFFNRLYKFKICKSKFTRTYIVDKKRKDKFARHMHALDKSKYCVKYVLAYEGDINLLNFLIGRDLPPYLVVSLALQICKIAIEFQNIGYLHNDLFLNNIMIKRTRTKSFKLSVNGKSYVIPHHGYILTVIDYGMALCIGRSERGDRIGLTHGMEKLKQSPGEQLWNEVMTPINNMFANISNLIYDCEVKKEELDWDKIGSYNVMTELIKNNIEFFTKAKNKYTAIHRGTDGIMDRILSLARSGKFTSHDLRKLTDSVPRVSTVVVAISEEIRIYKPDIYFKYNKWCSRRLYMVPDKLILKLLLACNIYEYIDILAHYI